MKPKIILPLTFCVATVLLFVSIYLLMDTQTLYAQDEPVTARENPPDGAAYEWVMYSDGFDNPVGLVAPPDDSGRLFVLEQGGLVWIIEPDGNVPLDPFLDISDKLPNAVFMGGYTEQGLLGLAFHPQYAENGLFFINYTDANGDSIISRWHVSDDPNLADTASEVQLLFVDQPFENHNGGGLAFGPDGYLYASFGDGGDQGDPFGHAQNPASLLGKILRLDVNNGETYTAPADNPFASDSAFAPEVWAMGLRNPWRFSFDRATGDLYIADVGEWQWEEVNFVPAGSAGGANFGWNLFESRLARVENVDIRQFTMPVVEYNHAADCSITGGYVYRGAALPDLQGVYLYGDYCSGRVWGAWRNTIGVWQHTELMNTGRQITSFGEDQAGEVYMVDYKGDILRLESAR